MARCEAVDKGMVEVKTIIDASHYSADIDLNDIGNMIKRYCNEVERLEEQLEEAKSTIEELEKAIDEYEGMA